MFTPIDIFEVQDGSNSIIWDHLIKYNLYEINFDNGNVDSILILSRVITASTTKFKVDLFNQQYYSTHLYEVEIKWLANIVEIENHVIS